MVIEIRQVTDHEKYKRDKEEIAKELDTANANYCQISGVDDWKASLFNIRDFDDISLIKKIGQMESVTKVSFNGG